VYTPEQSKGALRVIPSGLRAGLQPDPCGERKSEDGVAQFHMSVKVIGRSAGRSATGAAAYRSGERIVDTRTGEIHDYTRKGGVLAAALVLPGGAAPDRSEFWNGIELHHKRGDAVLAREFTLALPAELAGVERERLAFDYGRELADRYGVAVDVALHEPDKEGDQRNFHAHVMMSACTVEPDGRLGKKAVELDPIHCKRHGLQNFAERERPRWETLHNERMAANGRAERIDHRSLKDQGIDRPATTHLGPAVTSMARRKERSKVERWLHDEIADRLAAAYALGKEARALGQALIDTETELHAALAERERKQEEASAARNASTLAAVSEDEAREQDAKAIRATLAEAPHNKVLVNDAKPGQRYGGRILLVTGYHVAQDAGKDWATLHDKRQLQHDYEVDDHPRITYGADGRVTEQIQSPKSPGRSH
jgi:MobA/MobL family